VIGGGIFVITGQAAANHAGPAIMLSFVLAAICCAFCALAYAEFASMVPVSGSAYTYLRHLRRALGLVHRLDAGARGTASPPRRWRSAGPAISSACSASSTSIYRRRWSAPLDAAAPHRRDRQPAGRRAGTAADLAVLRRHQQVLGDEHGDGRAEDRPDRAGHRGRLEVRGHQQLDPFIPANEGPGKYGMEGVLRGAAMVFFAYIGFEAVSVAAQESKNRSVTCRSA
jgi:APA family basic amino acid/polyamine antiporter